jgi:hypothetical protein
MIARTPCPGCRTVSLLPLPAVLELPGSLLFRCPTCAGTQCVPLAEAPPPPVHPERAAPGPPLTLDDLIDLHELLHRGPGRPR